MTDEEVYEEFDRRLDAIYDEYVKAIHVYEAATEKKSKARKELDKWFAENYKGPKGGEWVVEL